MGSGYVFKLYYLIKNIKFDKLFNVCFLCSNVSTLYM